MKLTNWKVNRDKFNYVIAFRQAANTTRARRRLQVYHFGGGEAVRYGSQADADQDLASVQFQMAQKIEKLKRIKAPYEHLEKKQWEIYKIPI